MNKTKRIFLTIGIFALLGAFALFTFPFNVESVTTTPALYGTNVPAADSTANNVFADVIGNKSDAADTGEVTATDSIVGYVKQIVTQIRTIFSAVVPGEASHYYVDASVGSSGTGTTWDTAYLTMAEAIAVATTRNDVIHVAPGDYDDDAVINVTTRGLKIIGSGPPGGHQNKAMIWSGSASHLLTINAHEVVIDGIGFSAPDDGYDAIRVSTTMSAYKVTIRNCRFDAWSGEYAIHMGTTWDSPDLVIENNLFRYWNTAAIYSNATRAKIENNIFFTIASKIAIDHYPTTGGRPDTVIKDNVITGVNSGDSGIVINNAPSEGTMTIVGNSVENCASPITLAKYTTWYDGNYWGIDDAYYHSHSGNEYPGRVIYCDANVATTGLDGRSWASAAKTLVAAVAFATIRDDTIRMAIGDYDEGAVVNITTQGLQIIGEGNANGHQNKAMIYSGSASHLLTINNHEVLIDNVGFSMPDDAYDAIRVSTTMSAYKVTIQNCRFDAWNGEYAIHMGTTYDSPDLVIKNNLFRYWNTAAIYSNATRARIEGNDFFTIATAIAIDHYPTTGGRPDIIIKNNTITGVNSTDSGIVINNSPDEGTMTIVGNSVINCATPITLSKYTSWYEDNFWGKENWRYHPGDGREAAAARGAIGNIFYYDLNMSVTGLDGRSWASAFDTLAAAITASDADISATRGWAKRNTIYASADPMGETITDLPNRCDIVGVGTDSQPSPRWTVKATIAAATFGTRFYNWRFQQNTAAANISFVTGSNGIEFHDCEFYGGTTATYGVTFAATCGNIKIHNCDFIADSSGNKFQTAAIGITGSAAVYDIDIKDSYIEGTIGIAVASSITGKGTLRIRNCDIVASAITIDDDSDQFSVFNCRLISYAAAGGATAPGALDINAVRASGVYLMTSDSNGPFPNLSAHN